MNLIHNAAKTVNTNTYSTTYGCANFAFFFSVRSEMRNAHIFPRLEQKRINLTNKFAKLFFRFVAKCETIIFFPVSNENEYERRTLFKTRVHCIIPFLRKMENEETEMDAKISLNLMRLYKRRFLLP